MSTHLAGGSPSEPNRAEPVVPRTASWWRFGKPRSAGSVFHPPILNGVRPLVRSVEEMDGDALRGHLDMLLLAAIGAGDAYGYGLIRGLRDRSSGVIELSEGTVYPALHRLYRSGYVTRDEEWVDGRQRRTYELTDMGRELLAAQVDLWNEVQKAVEAVLAGTSTTTK